MANVKAAMEYAQTFEREAMKKRLSETGSSDLKLPTLIDVVAKHEKEIQELKRLIQPTTMAMEYAANFESYEKMLEKKPWVGLTDEEIRNLCWMDNLSFEEEIELIRIAEAILKRKNT